MTDITETMDATYFIEKFEPIPARNWITGKFVSRGGKRFCAFGHCGHAKGVGFTDEGRALIDLFFKAFNRSLIPGKSGTTCNDDCDEFSGYERTPKRRILKALRAMQEAGL